MAKRTNEQESQSPNSVPAQSSNIPSYLSSALRLSTSRPTGAPRVDYNVLGGNDDVSTIDTAVPGILALHYVPTLGYSDSANSAVNRAAFYEFNKIRSKISGNRPYEPADHMIYRMCVDGMRELYHYISRAYTMLTSYRATNLYTPAALFTSMGLDYDDWRANAAEVYQWLKMHESALAPFPTVPIGSISDRHILYNSVIFQDGDIDAAQYYIMNQGVFWSYEVVDQVKGVTPRKLGATWNEAVALWDEMYSALQNSSDVYIIAADIRRAFEDQATTALKAPGVDDTVQIVKLDPILQAVMNATIIPSGSATSSREFLDRFKIVDTNGHIFCAPIINVLTGGHIDDESNTVGTAKLSHINMVQANPSEMDVLNAIRLKPVMTLTAEASIAALTAFGTEVIYAGVINADPTSATVSGPNKFFRFGTLMGPSASSGFTGSREQDLYHSTFPAVLSNFDWHPPVVYIPTRAYMGGTIGVTVSEKNSLSVIEDVQNYIPISDEVLSNIHNANLLAEFGFPG